jgi:hypothetical protein
VGPGVEDNILALQKIEPRILGCTVRNETTILAELSQLPMYFIVYIKTL